MKGKGYEIATEREWQYYCQGARKFELKPSGPGFLNFIAKTIQATFIPFMNYKHYVIDSKGDIEHIYVDGKKKDELTIETIEEAIDDVRNVKIRLKLQRTGCPTNLKYNDAKYPVETYKNTKLGDLMAAKQRLLACRELQNGRMKYKKIFNINE